MRKTFISIGIGLALCFIQCQKEKDTTFLITKTSIGKLNKTSLARDIEVIYDQDSIVKDTTRLLSGYGAKKIKIFEKGIGLNSTFEDIKEKYTISKILTSLNNIVIILKNTDVYFTIDKEELPSTIRYNSNLNIEAVQVPDEAKVKYMMVGWEQ